MSMRAVHPMSHSATSGADDDFYREHPEMVRDGKRIPIDPHDPKQANLRHDWMLAYVKHGGKVNELKSKSRAHHVRQAAHESKTLPSNVGTSVSVVQCPTDKPPAPDLESVVKAPKPDKPVKHCVLVSATYTCEHGRHPSEEAVLCVVPDSYASIGDKITCVAKTEGGCGDHVEWSIAGFWTSTEHGNKTDFNAKTFKPAILGWLRLHRVDPQTYRVNALACEGGAPALEVRAYPPDKIETKLDFKKIREAIHEGFKLAPLSDVDHSKLEKEFLQISISCGEQWKEDRGSPLAFCECEVGGGADPLVKLERAFPIYPLSLIPAGLEDYVKAGAYITVGGEIGFKVSWVGKYWPDSAKWKHDKFQVALSGKVEGKLSANLFLMSKDLLNAEIAGVTSFTGTAKGSTGDEPAITLELLWGGLEAVITLQAGWGFIEYKKKYPILEERKIAEREYPLGGEEKGSDEQ